MGKYDVEAEEDEIRKVLAGKADLDDVVQDAQAVKTEDSIAGLLARIMARRRRSPRLRPPTTPPATAERRCTRRRWPSCSDALEEAYKTPGGAGRRGRRRLARLRPRSRSSSSSRRPTCGSGWRCCRRRYLAERKVMRGVQARHLQGAAARRCSPTPSPTSRIPPGRRRTTSGRCTRSSTGRPTGRWPASAATRSSPSAETWTTRPCCCSAR